MKWYQVVFYAFLAVLFVGGCSYSMWYDVTEQESGLSFMENLQTLDRRLLTEQAQTPEPLNIYIEIECCEEVECVTEIPNCPLDCQSTPTEWLETPTSPLVTATSRPTNTPTPANTQTPTQRIPTPTETKVGCFQIMCHKPGTAAEQNYCCDSQGCIDAHLAHGDYLGECR